ncbi:MAG TPA: hypothetical protein VFW73_02485 [Lacipirellulaceae bacterium]|nr:hypothetical protein [Lacipirellulaceae bacterium]
MAGVLDKIEQVRAMDPAAEQKLLDELRKVPPSTWPLVAEEFRASLAYHEQLTTKERGSPTENEPVADLRRAASANSTASPTTQLLANSLAYDHVTPTNDDRPSAPLGLLVDPHGISTDASASLTRLTRNSPSIPAANAAASTNPQNTPASFTADGTAYPITNSNDSGIDSPSRQPGMKAQQHVATQAIAQETSAPRAMQVTAEEIDKQHGPVRLPDTRPAPSNEDWRQLVKQAIADLERRVPASPSTTAEVHQHVSLRILYLLAGNTEKALKPIPNISATEQDYWSRQLFALATYLDHHTQPDDKRRAAAAVMQLDEAVSNLRELSSLSLRNLTFCKNVYGYGAIEPYEKNIFSPGQHVLAYVEVENYHSISSEKGFCTSLGAAYEVLDEHGKRVMGGDFPDVNDCCRSRRRDFHIQLGLTMPENMAEGRYNLQVVVKDHQSDKIGSAKAAFEIRGAKK